MPRFAILEAPSVLGLRPSGVEDLPEALNKAGLRARLAATHAGRLDPPPYDPRRDPTTGLLNPTGLREYSLRLAGAVSDLVRDGRFPIVLGGDCSILLGAMLGLRRLGRYGLFFLDGHADFYQTEASPTGEAADMDLALVSGRGPGIVADIDGFRPYVRDADIVVFGYRDAAQAAQHGSQDVRATGMQVFDLEHVRDHGVVAAATGASSRLLDKELVGFWIHLDADVLDDAVMPAVDYRMPGGLALAELSDLLRTLVATRKAVGMTIAIFNPRLDGDGSIARALVDSIVAGIGAVSR